MAKNTYLEFEEDERLVLPSAYVKKEKRRVTRRNSPYRKDPVFVNDNSQGGFKFIKWTIIIVLGIFLYFYYNNIVLIILGFLQSNPTLYNIYLFAEYEISNNSLRGLLIMSVLGSLFFLVLPSEALFIYYLSSTQYNFIIILLMMLLGSVIGLSFNYFFGRILGERMVQNIFKKNFDSYKQKIDKWGGLVLFFGNILPGPIEFLTVFFGAFKYDFMRFFYLCFMGRLVKFILIFFAFLFFWDELISLYDVLLENFLVLKSLYVG